MNYNNKTKNIDWFNKVSMLPQLKKRLTSNCLTQQILNMWFILLITIWVVSVSSVELLDVDKR